MAIERLKMDRELYGAGAQANGQTRAPVMDFDFYHDPIFDKEGSHLSVLKSLTEGAPPIFWSQAQGGYWVIRGHELAFAAAHETDLFSSKAMNIPRDDRELDKPPAVPINLDPPDHAAFRAPLAAIFSPQRMAKLEGRIRELAVKLISAVEGKGGCDFITSVSEPLPILTFMEMVGLDPSRLREFRDLAIVGSVDPDPVKRSAAHGRVTQLVSEFVERRMSRAEAGRDDITNDLIDIKIDGRRLTAEEVKNCFRLLFFAGLDTVVNALAFGMNYLARHTEVQAQLRRDPASIRLAVEELLRLGAPATLGRMVTRDEEWRGVALRQGDRVLLELTAANLDPTVFPDPLTFNLKRGAIPHLAFNSGPHRCLGQHLARIELRIVYEEWLGRIPTFRLDPARPPRMHGGLVRGVDTLPLVWE